jgi:hypothetical protein
MDVQAEDSGAGEQIILEEEIDEHYEPSDGGTADCFFFLRHDLMRALRRLGLCSQKYGSMRNGSAWTLKQSR